MHTITVDDEQIAINSLIRLLKKVDPSGRHSRALYADDFMRYIEENNPDIAFIDIDLYGTDGITLAKRAAELRPEMNIVMYTGHPGYKAAALDLYVSGYLVKPVMEKDLLDVLDHLRYPIKKVRIQCFGNFEVYVNDKPLKFKRKDSKEIFAYLIDRRGAEVSEDVLRCLLWSEEEDTDKKRNYIRNIIYDIRTSFAEAGVNDVIISRHGYYCADISSLECDYYDWLKGISVNSAQLMEYMEQFNAWSHVTKEKIFGASRS